MAIFVERTRIMKKAIILAVLLLAACTANPYHADYVARQEANNGALKPFMALPEGLSARETEALEFLYAYMPAADVTDYPAEFYLQAVRQSLQAREEMGWNVPEREFRHFVLPLRVNNESLDSARVVFYRELKPRVEGLSMQEAILEVNHWCHEKVTYQPSDARTMSPLNLVKNTLGRCGEESTFCVTALRSVGIPARQVYTPRWAHTDDNHAWVEAWADGQWHFLGACEPEPVLDLGWFNAPASRAMLMHTKVFGKYDGPEEVVLAGPNYTEVNLIDNYARTARADFQILNPDGTPADGARVDFCIYNYAEFYPAVTKYADADGRTFLSAGLGDMLVWASKDGAWGYAKVSFGKDTDVQVRMRGPEEDSLPDRESLSIVPPPETANIPEVTPELRAQNDRRFAYEDSLRHAYEATFPAGDKARGNWRTIRAFRQKENRQQVSLVLLGLSSKDLQDVTPELLEDYYSAGTPFMGIRVEDEFLTPFYTFFREHPLPVKTPQELVQWVNDSLTIDANPKAWNIPMSPAGVYKSRVASPRSRDIFFVSAARAMGFRAQKNPVTGKVQYMQDNGEWVDVESASVAPQGVLRLNFTPTRSIENPKYYSHFTISKLEDGRPKLLTFDEGEVDMGGGVDWAHVFRQGYPLEAGDYLLVSGNRLSDGSVPVSMAFFSVGENETTTVELRIDEPDSALPVIGSFNADPLLPMVGRGFFALAVLDPGKEPTNHVLRDLAAEKEALEAWGRPIVLYCENETSFSRLQKEIAEVRYGLLPANIQLALDKDGKVLNDIAKGMNQTAPGPLPLVILADSFNRVFFYSEGYTIGLGEQLRVSISRL